jgi:hypothetical protein
MSAATVDEVKALLAGQLHKESAADLGAYWNNIVPVALADAETFIRGKLLAKGATSQQITLWSRFHALHLRQSAYISGLHNQAELTTEQKNALDRLDVTAELDALTMMDGEILGGMSGRQSASGVFARAVSGTQRNPLAAPEYDRAYGDIPYPAI